MEKTAQDIGTLVVYTLKIAQAIEEGEADFEKEAARGIYRAVDRRAIRAAGPGANLDSQHLAEGVLERNVPLDSVVRVVRSLSNWFKKQRAKGPKFQIPNDQNWYREVLDKTGKLEGYVAGWGPRMRTVYNAEMGAPRGKKI